MLDPETRRHHNALAVAQELRREIACDTSELARRAGITRQSVYRCIDLAWSILYELKATDRPEQKLASGDR